MGKITLKEIDDNNVPLNVKKFNIVKRPKECLKQLNEEMHLLKIAKK